MKPTNLNFTSWVLLTSMPDVFSCRGAVLSCSLFWRTKGQVQKIRFFVVKNFRLNSNQFLVILIWSSELASQDLETKNLKRNNFYLLQVHAQAFHLLVHQLSLFSDFLSFFLVTLSFFIFFFLSSFPFPFFCSKGQSVQF